MKLSTIVLTTAIVLGAGMSGTAMAGGDYGRGHGAGGQRHYDTDRHWDHDRHGRHGGGHRHYRPHRSHYPRRDHGYRHWRRDDYRHGRDYRYPRDLHDSWYGIHLFFGGH